MINLMVFPVIRKSSKVIGRTLVFTNAIKSDAQFILNLRSLEKSRNLSQTPPLLSDQLNWLERYASDTTQAYFIIHHNNEQIGTVRLYDQRDVSFCWGSWILTDSRPSHAAVESALMVYSYAIDHLRFEKCHFDVRKVNDKAVRFHSKFGARIVDEDEKDYFFELNSQEIFHARQRYERFLPDPIRIIE
jgi:RimJ/RimL family protein N-acetyltransferase